MSGKIYTCLRNDVWPTLKRAKLERLINLVEMFIAATSLTGAKSESTTCRTVGPEVIPVF